MMKDPMMTFLKVLGQETPAPVAFDEGRTLDLGLLGGQVVVSQWGVDLSHIENPMMSRRCA